MSWKKCVLGLLLLPKVSFAECPPSFPPPSADLRPCGRLWRTVPPSPRLPVKSLPAQASLATVMRVLEWATGTRKSPQSMPPADIVRVPISGDKAAAALEDKKKGVAATSLLTSADGERIYLLRGGQLHTLRWQAAVPQLVAGALPTGVRLVHLLAIALINDGRRLYASGIQSAEYTPVLLQIDLADNPGGEKITRVSPVLEADVPTTRDSFFATHHVPRCITGGERCLDVEFRAGKSYLRISKEPPRSLGEAEAASPVWADIHGDAVYLLVRGLR